jgi:hypothetical protein
MHGLNLLDKDKLLKLKYSIEQVVDVDFFKRHGENYKQNIKTIAGNSIDHYEMIQILKGENEN